MSTKIEWTDKVWNPTTGCTKGCSYCYAQIMAGRLQRMGQEKYRSGFTPACHPQELEKPLRWKKPCRIFVNSMGDLFDPAIPDHFIYRVLNIISQAPRHTFQVLTKYPERMRNLINNHWQPTIPRLLNLWLGVSVTNQAEADDRIPLLLQTTAAIRFVSIEPMLGPVDLERVEWPNKGGHRVDVLRGGFWSDSRWGFVNHSDLQESGLINWVICGGMTGSGAVKLKGEWVARLRDQCKAAGVSFYFKGWGQEDKRSPPWVRAEIDGKRWQQFPITNNEEERNAKTTA